jgi:MFS family permease
MYSLNAVIVVLLQPFSYMLTSKREPYKVIFWGNAIFVMACLITFLFPFSKSLFVFFIIMITVGEVLVVPTQSVLTDLLAPPEQRGLYFGAATLRQAGSAAGPMLGGFALEKFGQSAVFLLMMMLNLGSALLNRHAQRQKAKEEKIV